MHGGGVSAVDRRSTSNYFSASSRSSLRRVVSSLLRDPESASLIVGPCNLVQHFPLHSARTMPRREASSIVPWMFDNLLRRLRSLSDTGAKLARANLEAVPPPNYPPLSIRSHCQASALRSPYQRQSASSQNPAADQPRASRRQPSRPACWLHPSALSDCPAFQPRDRARIHPALRSRDAFHHAPVPRRLRLALPAAVSRLGLPSQVLRFLHTQRRPCRLRLTLRRKLPKLRHEFTPLSAGLRE